MRISLALASLLLLVPLLALAQAPMPMMNGVDPTAGKAGDALVVQGSNLGADVVAEVYLTDGKADYKVVIVEQTSTAIKFKIPATAKAGRLALMVLTKSADPKLIEQPVKVVVEGDTGT